MVAESFAVTSLGWVTPGAATEGVTPLFFPVKPGDLFQSPVLRCHPCLFSSKKLATFLLSSLSAGITPHLFYLSALVSPLLFVNLPTKKILSSGVTPLEGVTRGGPPPAHGAPSP